MATIQVLSTEISNKIAAGEVVERPASVVKELVENSIDAGATVISVEIENGGTTYIRITDNGSGIAPEDAMIAFLRHATSKISTAEDLNAIYTLGFRGEALSSIGAVAQVDLFTKRAEDENGTHIVCTGGEIVSGDEAGTPNGTTITVRNLFFNMPARMKFLKKDATEAGYIADIMTRFILAHPEISFRFINHGKEQLFSAGDNSLSNCIYTVYGKDYAKAMLPVSYENDGVRISGVIGRSDAVRPNRNYQSFFVNRRYIKSPLMIRALEEAYKNQIMIGKFPVAALNLEIDPSQIDINVHPTKLEVKFSEESLIYRTVYHAVQNTLYQTVNVPEISRPEPAFSKDTQTLQQQISIAEIPKEPKMTKTLPHWEDLAARTDAAERIVSMARPVKNPCVSESYQRELSLEYFQKEQERIAGAENAKAIPIKTEPEEEPDVLTEMIKKLSDTKQTMPSCAEPVRVIGQVFATYVLAERGEEMLIIDQHAAHERMKFEELKAALANREIHPQEMLAPVVVNLSSTEFALFQEHKDRLDGLGFETEEFGVNTVLVRAVPKPMEEEQIRQVIAELLQNIGNSKNQIITQQEERLLYTIACKAAIKANHNMQMPELEELVKRVLELENINTCPHGRPIVIRMTKKEMEKEFGRIV